MLKIFYTETLFGLINYKFIKIHFVYVWLQKTQAHITNLIKSNFQSFLTKVQADIFKNDKLKSIIFTMLKLTKVVYK